MSSTRRPNRLLKILRRSKVAVFHPPDEDAERLEKQLRRIGCQVELHWPPPAAPIPELDALVFLENPDHTGLHHPYSDQRSAALVAIVEFENPLAVQQLVDANVHGTIAKPIQPIGILSCLAAALSLHRYESRLLTRIEKLDETLRSRRAVEKAVAIVSRRKELSEEEAYTLVRREAMNKQISVADMAMSILNAEQLFG